jgi:hypothetical protein
VNIAGRARRLRRRVGFRGDTLLFFSVIDICYGLSMIFPGEGARRSAMAGYVGHILPLTVWGCIFLAVAAVCIWYALRLRDRVAFAASSVLKAVWGLVALLGWAVGDVERGWVSAAIWLVMSAWVTRVAYWPEPMPTLPPAPPPGRR